MKFLIDECLHASLVTVANEGGFEAHHVIHLGLQGKPDHELMARVRKEECIFVTNNGIDFEKLFAREEIHAGLIVILKSVPPKVQRALFRVTLEFIGDDEPVNSIIRIDWDGSEIDISQYNTNIP